MDNDKLCINDNQGRNYLIRLPYGVLLLAILLLAGCGGGSDDSPSSTNQAPVANNDDASTTVHTTVNINVIQNDTDVDGTIDPSTVTITTQPTNGSTNNNGDGNITYTPNNGFGGPTDSFNYTVKDDTGAVSNEATVTVTVRSVNVPPTAADSCGFTNYDETLEKERLTGELSDLITDPDTTVFRYNILQQGAIGTVEVQPATGMYTYTATAEGKIWAKSDSFTYEVVDDSDGSTATGEVKVVVGKTRIMPLGDSITAGITGMGKPDGGPNFPAEESKRVGYRGKLYDDLKDAAVGGFQVDFVGSQNDGLGAGIGDPNHEGWPGRRDDDFIDLKSDPPTVAQLLTNNPADIVLLHIGSNDLNENPIDKDADEVKVILQDIKERGSVNNPVTVFLALITDRITQHNNTFNNPDVDDFNKEIIKVANEFKIDPDPKFDIILVDQHSALKGPEDFSTEDEFPVHPNAGGYAKMANKWLESIIDSDKAPRCPPSP